MKISLALSVMLLALQFNPSNQISIRQNGNTIATVEKSDYILPVPGGIFLDVNLYNQFLKKLEQQIYKKPLNATIDDQGKIQPEQAGLKLDREAFSEKLYKNFFNTGSNSIEVPTFPIYPQVDSELLSTIYEKRIGQYITYYNANNKQRSHNILLASEAINNQVIFPGQTFSFNHIVGKRTIEKGYLLATVIVKGELSEGIGGGICQVSSTLFNAVDNAGLKIIQRYSHSKRVAYVPEGRDATVSWYGPDFRFQNKFNQPILLKTKTHEGKLIITVFSSDLIHFKPKRIPSASQKLPEETKVNILMDRSNQE